MFGSEPHVCICGEVEDDIDVLEQCRKLIAGQKVNSMECEGIAAFARRRKKTLSARRKIVNTDHGMPGFEQPVY